MQLECIEGALLIHLGYIWDALEMRWAAFGMRWDAFGMHLGCIWDNIWTRLGSRIWRCY